MSKLRIVLISWLIVFLLYPFGLPLSANKSLTLEYKNSLLEQSPSMRNIQINEKLVKTTSISTTEDILVSFGTDAKYSPATAVDADGNLWTVYAYYNNTYYLLDVLRSTNDGENWTRLVYIYSFNLLANPDIAIDIYDNNIYIVYEEAEVGNASSHDIYIFRYNQWDIKSVDNDDQNDRNPSVAIDNNGTDDYLFIAYENVVNVDNRKMIVQKSTDGGATWEIWHTRGYSDDFVYTQPDIIIDFFDEVYVVYAFGEDNDTIRKIQIEYGLKNSSSDHFENTREPFSSSSAPVNYPAIAISRSTLFATRIVVAFQWLWSENDHDVLAASSVDGGNSWLISMVGVTDYWEGKPNIISDGMDVSSNVLGNFYIVYGFATFDDEWFVISQAPYSNPTNWTTLEFYWGTKDILMTTNHVFGVTTYSNTNSTLVVTYAANQIYLANYSSSYIGTDAFITIISPNITTVWNAQETERIQWVTFGVIDNVDILLLEGSVIVEWIAENVPNTGYYDWEVPTSREPGTSYSVAITDSNNSRISSLSFKFEITNTNVTYPAIYFTNPTPVSAWRAGATYVITWNCKVDLGEVTLELYKDEDKIETLSRNVDGESHFKWEIPEETPEGEDYRLKIFLNDNPYIYGISEEFKIITSRMSLTDKTKTMSLPTNGLNPAVLILTIIILILYKRKQILGG